MASRFAAGKKAIAVCDRCGFQYKLKELKPLVVNDNNTNLLVCKECWEIDHPQNDLGKYIVNDPQALRNPRPDYSYDVSGSLQIGSRDTQWGWRPVGYRDVYNLGVPNQLEATASVGTVTVTTT